MDKIAAADSVNDVTLGKRVDLSEKRLSAPMIAELAEALKVNTTLTSIDLGYNKIGDAGAEQIAEALKVNKTLTSIN
eukprot:CAMPEP_0168591766 /NCGR_PEP_ID=MMETSP0420-20121227/7321_1 /TAXON_ID=498008 /ORGANISM="Pessonella sp." /LENGTH=76 /DNA_ID=CAMNT_0008627603 /DNA_START=431 /DNA_END=659 /DNA_ORIENTATION=+